MNLGHHATEECLRPETKCAIRGLINRGSRERVNMLPVCPQFSRLALYAHVGGLCVCCSSGNSCSKAATW
eukprot:4446679-Alexandrium_andersonii.AAC.1